MMIRCDNDFGKSNSGGDSDAGFDVVNDNDDVVLIGYVGIERRKNCLTVDISLLFRLERL